MRAKLKNYFRAAYPAVCIQTTDEPRACAEVVAVAKELSRGIVTWSASEGAIDVGGGGRQIPDTEDLLALCRQRRERTVWIVRDPQTWPFDRDPVLARSWRDFIASAPGLGSSVVIVAPSYQPHPTVEKLVVMTEFALPAPDDLRAVARGIAESAGREDLKAGDDVVRALGGLTTAEAENALALSLIETGTFEPAIVYREKCAAVRRTGLLEIVDPDPRGLDAIGGLDQLKTWIGRRRRAWSPEAEAFGLPAPKGLLLVGVPGTGKSLSAKAIGTALGVPTLRLDIGALFNSLVGESEARTRDALKLAEALAPCVLWVDEIDKGLAGSSGSGSGDSGVTRRVFGSIISWMQERRRPVFFVATANQVDGLPPELLRKGRFDEVFAVDLPTADERAAILALQLRARRRDPAGIDLQAVAAGTREFTGAELEAVVTDALFEAFDAGADVTTARLLEAARATVPLATTAKEKIEAIREWARTRARFASTQPAAPSTSPGIRSIG